MTILYHSTRGQAPILNIRDATLAGLAEDGGLYLPQTWPQFETSVIGAWKTAPYTDIAFAILRPFMAGVLDDATLKRLITKAYAVFDHGDITPLRALTPDLHVLELFHGPTLAFKDIALQFLGHVFEHFITEQQRRITIVGATSGDTGSAAMMALSGRKNIDVFILYPKRGPSEIQRRQMTTVDAPNVHAVAVDGSFDDCQRVVKALFADTGFRMRHNLGAINSINWLRILAQMVYYFVASARLGAHRPISFVVPTGNFGNVFAAYAATKCGLIASKLAVASNRNDVLTRFFNSGAMQPKGVQTSLSPSMDIEISSNFERLLFDLCHGDSARLCAYMAALKQTGNFLVTPRELGEARQIFTAAEVSDEETIMAIREIYEKYGYVLDPHSAVAMKASQKLARELPTPTLSLACAHPAKFPDTIEKAIGQRPALPAAVADILQKPERLYNLPPDTAAVAKFIEERV